MSYNYTTTVLDEQTVVRTYNHENLNVPFRIQVKRLPNPNQEMGNWFNFEVKELNLDVEKTIPEAELLNAIRYYGTDIGELSEQLFIGQDGLITTQSQFDKLQAFSQANVEYKHWQITSNGLSVEEVQEDNWIQFLLSDFCFFMAEALVQLYQASLKQYEDMNQA